MSKVIQIRDVPESVHDALAASARTQGLSLQRYLRRELEHIARRPDIARHNAAIVLQTQKAIRDRVDRGEILTALDEGRG
jgi:hypothetical protein